MDSDHPRRSNLRIATGQDLGTDGRSPNRETLSFTCGPKSPSYGFARAMISHNKIEYEKTSALRLYGSFRITSTAIYLEVPVFPASLNVVSGSSWCGISTASPKSKTFNTFWGSNPILAGLRS